MDADLRFQRARRKISLGSASDISCDARDAAARERANVASGADRKSLCCFVRPNRRPEREQALSLMKLQRKRASSTLRSMFEVWLADGVQRADDNAELRELLRRTSCLDSENRPVRTVTDTDLRDRTAKGSAKPQRGRTAERMLSELRQLYRWSIKRQPWKSMLIDGNPAELVETKQDRSVGYEPTNSRQGSRPQELQELKGHLRSTKRNTKKRLTAAPPLAVATRSATRSLDLPRHRMSNWRALKGAVGTREHQ